MQEIDPPIDQSDIYHRAYDILMTILAKARRQQALANAQAGIVAGLIDARNIGGPQYVYGGPCVSIGGALAADLISPPCAAMMDGDIVGLTILLNIAPTTLTVSVLLAGIELGPFACDGVTAVSFLASELPVTTIGVGDVMTASVISADGGEDLTVQIRARLDILTGPSA